MALPTFKIRDLHAPAQHGVIDITVPQYDDTITTHPSSVLTYIDHDDGETVTVGSGFELSERLVEPAQYSFIPRRRSGSAASRLSSDEKVHIFDIQRTSENLKIWRDYAALPNTPSPLALAPVDKPTPVPEASSVTQRAGAPTAHEARSPTANDVLRTACRGLETHIDAFAGFLDLTAAALQAAAQKTREADTTPIENLLTGLKNVLVEVGQVGMEVLREFEPKSPQQSQTSPQEQTSGTQATSSAQTAPKEQLRSSPKQVSIDSHKKVEFAVPSYNGNSRVQAKAAERFDSFERVHSHILKTVESTMPVWATTFKRPSPPIFGSGPAIENAFRDQPARTPYRSFPNRPALPPPAPAPTKTSRAQGESLLMDEDASNVDFAQRYPPLISLKRARTIATLHKESAKDDPANPTGSTKSALTRYPSIGQLESRRESAAFPWRRGSGPKSQQANVSDGYKDRSLRGYRKAAVEDDPQDAESASAGAVKGDSNMTQTSSDTPDGSLPGAWPSTATAVLVHFPDESLRLKRFFTQKDMSARPVSPALSCRITSPPAESFDQPTNTLRRAQTVTASNPAARLNGPFDPMNVAPSYQGQVDTLRTNGMPRRSLTQWLPRLETDVTDSQSARWANRRQRHAAYQRVAMPGSFPSGPVSQNQSQLSHSLRSGPDPVHQKDTDINNCVRTLKNMGYASNSNEESRLAVYAAAASGDVLEAIDIIEEERRAAKDIMSL
ncbi:uncharacterized protein AB675_3806 [Cyphellophora attinorum]|uniref:Uncharacterized protein n=1 Tax=Cyphellophora attinorum TaxID=1664694 RepID=A0A0N0NI14_9EURO|nr:uncharacterized protein AB675_3806 [Phialophora attinorum]KPI34919.1 hypothetical protein AB675_3806 [Phialophora attinorum]